MKLLSLSRQHFNRLIEDGCLYVDKTQLIGQMVTEFGQVFLSRPRRFGKSLLLSTIAQLYMGRKDLFAGTWIENNWNWDDTYPVVHFYMDKTGFKEGGLERGIGKHLNELAHDFGLTLQPDQPGFMLQDLILQLNEKTSKPVVLLFDEYDKPINDCLTEPELAEANREMLSNFYGVLKPNSDKIKFLMLTGVSKFSHVSVFSKLNQLQDLTFNQDYLTLLGYTQEELETCFDFWLEKARRELGMERDAFLAEVKHWYNGYSWDGKTFVYNPVSVMRFFQERRFRNFWFTTGTPEFLVKLLKNRNFVELDEIEVGQHVFETFTLENLETAGLLLQTGYVTVKAELPGNFLRLGYPNHEVRMSMMENLMRAFGRQDAALVGPNIYKLREAFYRNDLKTAMSIVNTLFQNIPHQLTRKHYELDFHAMLFLVFRYMAMDARAEVSSLRGRSDVVLFCPDKIFVIEFKINQTAQIALDYAREQEYAEPYRHEGLPIVLLGINFNSEEQMVDDWKTEPL